MSDVAMHPAAPHHVPAFFTAPGESDTLLYAMAIFLILIVVLIGNFYFKLHSLPERLAHKGQKIQFEIVAILGLLSLFTHNHAFWIAALLLAFIPIPDFWSPLAGMNESLAKMSGRNTDEVGEFTDEPVEKPITSNSLKEKNDGVPVAEPPKPAVPLPITAPGNARNVQLKEGA
jgi:hypothetical protein